MIDEIKEIEMIRDCDILRVWRFVGQSNRLVICFSGLGKDHSQPPGIEFAETAIGDNLDHVLYISDPNRSWLNQPGLVDEIVALIDEVKLETDIDDVATLGHSMGGFSACVLPYFTPVQNVLALSPQVSVDPAIVPDDPRWMEHREAIDGFEISDVASYLVAETQYVVVYGRHGREAPQRDRFPNPDQLSIFVMPQTNHNTAARLKGSGALQELRDLVFDGKIEEVGAHLAKTMRAYQLEGEPIRPFGEDSE
jgi:pimeloyl-ACP methyl ester carboxylesterase